MSQHYLISNAIIDIERRIRETRDLKPNKIFEPTQEFERDIEIILLRLIFDYGVQRGPK